MRQPVPRLHAVLGSLAPITLLCLAACGGEVNIDNNTGGGGSEIAPYPGPAAGHYVLAISLLYAPPLMFDAALDVDAREFSVTLQPLAVADRTTPVGAPWRGGPFPLTESGLYAATLGPLLIRQAALPAFPLAGDTEAEIQLNALEPTCGLSPIEFFYDFGTYVFPESTFALQPASVPDAHTNPIIDCEGNHAEPLP